MIVFPTNQENWPNVFPYMALNWANVLAIVPTLGQLSWFVGLSFIVKITKLYACQSKMRTTYILPNPTEELFNVLFLLTQFLFKQVSFIANLIRQQ